MSGSDLDKRVNRTLHQLREDQYLGVFPDYRPMEEVAAGGVLLPGQSNTEGGDN
jgi:hypothetical protein